MRARFVCFPKQRSPFQDSPPPPQNSRLSVSQSRRPRHHLFFDPPLSPHASFPLMGGSANLVALQMEDQCFRIPSFPPFQRRVVRPTPSSQMTSDDFKATDPTLNFIPRRGSLSVDSFFFWGFPYKPLSLLYPRNTFRFFLFSFPIFFFFRDRFSHIGLLFLTKLPWSLEIHD